MIDSTDQLLLEALTRNARMSLKELAAHAGLSSPSAAERIRKLEERGVIRGFTVEIDPAALGYTLEAVVRIRPLPGKLHVVQKLIEEIPEVVACDKVTGDDCFVARLHARSMGELDSMLDRIADKASTNTSLVKAHTVTRRPPPLAGAASKSVDRDRRAERRFSTLRLSHGAAFLVGSGAVCSTAAASQSKSDGSPRARCSRGRVRCLREPS